MHSCCDDLYTASVLPAKPAFPNSSPLSSRQHWANPHLNIKKHYYRTFTGTDLQIFRRLKRKNYSCADVSLSSKYSSRGNIHPFSARMCLNDSF